MAFDFRANLLTTEPTDEWDPEARVLHESAQAGIREGLLHQYGVAGFRQKERDFIDILVAPVSVLSSHNSLLAEVRSSFVAGLYFPALVGAAALGERVLNDLILELRDDFAGHELTKRVSKDSIDNWKLGIGVLRAWTVLDEATAVKFNRLGRLRNQAIHFNLRQLHETGARAEALEAILLLQEIVDYLFTAYGGPPRFIAGTPGEAYLSLAAEAEPLVQRFYLPNCALVSRQHRYVDYAQPTMQIVDNIDFETDHGLDALTDEEFASWAPRSVPTAGGLE